MVCRQLGIAGDSVPTWMDAGSQPPDQAYIWVRGLEGAFGGTLLVQDKGYVLGHTGNQCCLSSAAQSCTEVPILAVASGMPARPGACRTRSLAAPRAHRWRCSALRDNWSMQVRGIECGGSESQLTHLAPPDSALQ